ncbi:MAG: hypothetical protein GY783_18400, partial [Gammaproteobacteria bacterium]|nr:hypothetical protein [Gammaproteobacteria bacterium]
FPAWTIGSLERLLGLIEHLLDPSVDLAWLHAKLVGQVGNRYFVGQMSETSSVLPQLDIEWI